MTKQNQIKVIKITELDQYIKKLGYDQKDLIFMSDSQDVEFIKDYCQLCNQDLFNSFYGIVQDGDYVFIAGMSGIIPYNYKDVYILVE